MRQLILVFYLTLFANACNQAETLLMTDAMGQIYWNSSELNQPQHGFGKYGAQNLFDKDPKTAWAEGENDSGLGVKIRFVAKEKLEALEIINGYGKNEKTFRNNNRVKDFELTLYRVIFPPEGMATENAIPITFKEKYLTLKWKLKDSIATQKIILPPKWKKLIASKNTRYAFEFKVLSIYRGDKFDDTCLSEINFLFDKKKKGVELRRDDSEIWIDGNLFKKSAETIFQIVEIDSSRRWAILIEMPKIAEGRVETTYKLLSINAKKVIPQENYGSYIYELYGFKTKNGKIYLNGFNSKNNTEELIDLSKVIIP